MIQIDARSRRSQGLAKDAQSKRTMDAERRMQAAIDRADFQTVIECLQSGANPACQLRGGVNAQVAAALQAGECKDPVSQKQEFASIVIADHFSSSPAASPQAECELGIASLHAAALRGHTMLIHALLSHGIAVDTPATGRDRRHASRGDTSIVLGCMPEIVKGRTPLAFACMHEMPSAALVLLHAGANPAATDDAGMSVLEIAKFSNSHKCARLIANALQSLNSSSKGVVPLESIHAAGFVRCRRGCNAWISPVMQAAHDRSCSECPVPCKQCKQFVKRGHLE